MSTTGIPPLSLGRSVRAARLGHHRSAQDVAAAAGISPQYLSDIELCRRVPPVELTAKLEDVLGLPTPMLLWAWVREHLGTERALVLAAWLRAWPDTDPERTLGAGSEE